LIFSIRVRRLDCPISSLGHPGSIDHNQSCVFDLNHANPGRSAVDRQQYRQAAGIGPKAVNNPKTS
jgi:hypothetical protein